MKKTMMYVETLGAVVYPKYSPTKEKVGENRGNVSNLTSLWAKSYLIVKQEVTGRKDSNPHRGYTVCHVPEVNCIGVTTGPT